MKNGTLLLLAAAAYFLTRKKAPKAQPEPEPTPDQPLTLAPGGGSMFSMTTPRPMLPATAQQARVMPRQMEPIKKQTSIPGLTVIKKPGAPGLNFGTAQAGMTRGTLTIG